MQEDVISERELVEAFRTFDKDENGYISYREFMDIFTNVNVFSYFFQKLNKSIFCSKEGRFAYRERDKKNHGRC